MVLEASEVASDQTHQMLGRFFCLEHQVLSLAFKVALKHLTYLCMSADQSRQDQLAFKVKFFCKDPN